MGARFAREGGMEIPEETSGSHFQAACFLRDLIPRLQPAPKGPAPSATPIAVR